MVKKCFNCKKSINEKENYCSLVSHSSGKVVHEDHWHAKCWGEWLEEKMDRKVREYAKKMMSIAIPQIKPAMEERGMLN